MPKKGVLRIKCTQMAKWGGKNKMAKVKKMVAMEKVGVKGLFLASLVTEKNEHF